MSIIISLLAFVVSIFKPAGKGESTYGEGVVNGENDFDIEESCPECNAPAHKMHATKCPRHPNNYDEFINNQEEEDMNNQLFRTMRFTNKSCTVIKTNGEQCTINGGFLVQPYDETEYLVCHLHKNLIVNKGFQARFTGAWINPTEEKKEEEVKMGPIAQAWVTGESPDMEHDDWVLPEAARQESERLLITFVKSVRSNQNVFLKKGQIKKEGVANLKGIMEVLKVENLRNSSTRIAGWWFRNEAKNSPDFVLVKASTGSWAFAISFVQGECYLSDVTDVFIAMKKEDKLVIR